MLVRDFYTFIMNVTSQNKYTITNKVVGGFGLELVGDKFKHGATKLTRFRMAAAQTRGALISIF